MPLSQWQAISSWPRKVAAVVEEEEEEEEEEAEEEECESAARSYRRCVA